jgi:hypothetical protein
MAHPGDGLQLRHRHDVQDDGYLTVRDDGPGDAQTAVSQHHRPDVSSTAAMTVRPPGLDSQ